ncbi:MAG: hypothetical protein ACTHOP_04450 [Mesorhizobium sp.]
MTLPTLKGRRRIRSGNSLSARQEVDRGTSFADAHCLAVAGGNLPVSTFHINAQESDHVNGDEALMGEGRPLPGTRVAELIDLLDADED